MTSGELLLSVFPSLATRMVLDGWPLTMSQVELMKKHHILPAMFVALQVSEEECARRAERESSQPSRYKGWTGAVDACLLQLHTQQADILAVFHIKLEHYGLTAFTTVSLYRTLTVPLILKVCGPIICTLFVYIRMWCLPLFSVGPLHNSEMAHQMRVQAYQRHSAEVRQWYEVQHRNWHCVDGEGSRWKVWESTAQLVTPRLKEIQLYIDQIPQGKWKHARK